MLVSVVTKLAQSNAKHSLSFRFWETINKEHGVNLDGEYIGTNDRELDQISIYYNQVCNLLSLIII